MYPKDFLSDGKAMAMSNECFGIYVKLLFFDWIDDGLPLQSKCWWNMTNTSIPRDSEILKDYEVLLRRCFTAHPKKPGFVTSPKLLEYRKHLTWVSKVRSDSARKKSTANAGRKLTKSHALQASNFKLQETNSKQHTLKSLPSCKNEVLDFFKQSSSTVHEAENFWDHFESNGWKVSGRTPMKDWRAAARKWMRTAGHRPTAPAPQVYRCEQCQLDMPMKERYEHLKKHSAERSPRVSESGAVQNLVSGVATKLVAK